MIEWIIRPHNLENLLLLDAANTDVRGQSVDSQAYSMGILAKTFP